MIKNKIKVKNKLKNFCFIDESKYALFSIKINNNINDSKIEVKLIIALKDSYLSFLFKYSFMKF